MRSWYNDPEPPVTPPDLPERAETCPVCGAAARNLYFTYGECFGCDVCVKTDLVDDVLDIPETEPLPPCNICGAVEQTVYLDNTGEIRACAECVVIKRV